MKDKFIIGSFHKETEEFSAAKEPKGHPTFAVAKKEAERLAKLDTDKKFVVLEIKGIVSVSSVVWE